MMRSLHLSFSAHLSSVVPATTTSDGRNRFRSRVEAAVDDDDIRAAITELLTDGDVSADEPATGADAGMPWNGPIPGVDAGVPQDEPTPGVHAGVPRDEPSAGFGAGVPQDEPTPGVGAGVQRYEPSAGFGGSETSGMAIGSAPVFVARADVDGVRFVAVGDPPMRLRRRDGAVEEQPVGCWSTPRTDVEAFEFDLDGHRIEWAVPAEVPDVRRGVTASPGETTTGTLEATAGTGEATARTEGDAAGTGGATAGTGADAARTGGDSTVTGGATAEAGGPGASGVGDALEPAGHGGASRDPVEELTLPPDAVADLIGADALDETDAADEADVSPATTTQPAAGSLDSGPMEAPMPGAGGGCADAEGRPVGAARAGSDRRATAASVRAVHCPSGHPNPLTARHCRICRHAITDFSVDVVARPVLARLVFDSGTVVSVDRPLVIGRRPTVPAGWSDDVGLVTRSSAGGDLSRVHVLLRVDGWDLSLEDAGSLNGTEVQSPDGVRRRLREHDPVPVGPGVRVTLGEVDGFVIEAVTES